MAIKVLASADSGFPLGTPRTKMQPLVLWEHDLNEVCSTLRSRFEPMPAATATSSISHPSNQWVAISPRWQYWSSIKCYNVFVRANFFPQYTKSSLSSWTSVAPWRWWVPIGLMLLILILVSSFLIIRASAICRVIWNACFVILHTPAKSKTFYNALKETECDDETRLH